MVDTFTTDRPDPPILAIIRQSGWNLFVIHAGFLVAASVVLVKIVIKFFFSILDGVFSKVAVVFLGVILSTEDLLDVGGQTVGDVDCWWVPFTVLRCGVCSELWRYIVHDGLDLRRCNVKIGPKQCRLNRNIIA